MSERLKKSLLIIAFIIFACGLGYVLYSVFFRPKAAPIEPTTEQPGTIGELPSSGTAGERPTATTGEGTGLPPSTSQPGEQPTEGLPASAQRTQLLNEGISRDVSAAIDGNGARFYDPADAKFYKIDSDGTLKALSDQTFPNVDSVVWGNTSDQAILNFPDGSNVLYNFVTQKQTTLPKHWDGFDFSNNDNQIVAKNESDSPESRYLIVASPDGSNAQAIEPLGENSNKTFPAWTPNGDIIAYATTGQAKGFDRQEIILVGKNHENYNGLVVEGRGFEPLWSPSGQIVLYSVWTVANDYKPELWVSGGAPGNINQNRQKLSVQTWAFKCAWHNETEIICGVPETMPRGAGFQPDQFQNTSDRIVRINLADNTVTDLGKPDGGPTVKDPILSTDGSELIFTDAVTGKLYKFGLF